jgi:hypothetical protein
MGIGDLGAGAVAVSDTFRDRVLRIRADGSLGAPIGGGPGSGPGQFRSPRGIARGPFGDVYVADTFNDRVQRFGADGRLLDGFGGLHHPEDVAVDPLGNVYVADTGAGEIVKYSILGTVVARWGGFDHPAGVAVAGTDRVFVSDSRRARIVELDGQGRRRAVFGARGSAPGEFIRPGGLAVDAAGDLWVTDARNNRVQLFTFRRSAPRSTPPAQAMPVTPHGPLTGRLLIPRRVLPAHRPLVIGCRSSRRGICDLTVQAGRRLVARSRARLPTAGVAQKIRLRLPASVVRGPKRSLTLSVSALIRSHTGQRVTATGRLVLSAPARRHHARRQRRDG